jgi:hypothetical protein
MPQMKGVKELRLLVQQLKPGRYGGDGRSLSGHICFFSQQYPEFLVERPGLLEVKSPFEKGGFRGIFGRL